MTEAVAEDNQQNREYYSLRLSEVQKELSGIKVELGSPR